MWRDPVVEEVRNIREARARKFNYDLQAIYREIKKQEKTSGRKLISFPPRRMETVDQPE